MAITPATPKPEIRAWSPSLRVAFRFCFVYFTLYSLSNQIFGGLLIIPKVNLPGLGAVWPLRQLTFWIASHVFRVKHALVYTGSGSGDKTFDWVQAAFLLFVAIVATAVWSFFASSRADYTRLHKWFRTVMRFTLASEMFLYGFDKLIPLQMPFPFLTRLVEPFGNFSPMGVLWYSVGASRSYEIFAGSAEVLGGLLLIAPRTTTFGALICLADLVQVFVLNMTYDVPVKLFSFNLILMTLFVLAPDLRRMVRFFFTDRAPGASRQPPLFRTLRANRIAVAVQIVFGLYLAGMNIATAVHSWHTYGGARPKPSLYGVWDVEQMSIDGQVRSPLVTDYDRWRRVIFDFTTNTYFQRMDESLAGFGSSIDDANRKLNLTKSGDKNWKASFSFVRPANDQLLLDGTMDGHKVHMELKLFDRNKFTLVNRGFHWINEYPYQR